MKLNFCILIAKVIKSMKNFSARSIFVVGQSVVVAMCSRIEVELNFKKYINRAKKYILVNLVQLFNKKMFFQLKI